MTDSYLNLLRLYSSIKIGIYMIKCQLYIFNNEIKLTDVQIGEMPKATW